MNETVKKTCSECVWFFEGDCRHMVVPKPVNPIAKGCTDFRHRENPDAVNHPAHYQSGGLECIDVIRAVTGSGFAGFLLGNVLKYLWRYRQKNGAEDLKKAAWYLERLIKAEDET